MRQPTLPSVLYHLFGRNQEMYSEVISINALSFRSGLILFKIGFKTEKERTRSVDKTREQRSSEVPSFSLESVLCRGGRGVWGGASYCRSWSFLLFVLCTLQSDPFEYLLFEIEERVECSQASKLNYTTGNNTLRLHPAPSPHHHTVCGTVLSTIALKRGSSPSLVIVTLSYFLALCERDNQGKARWIFELSELWICD